MIEHFAPTEEADEARLVLQPNQSLSLRQTFALFAALAATTLVVVGIAWRQGNVFAPPFAVLSLSLLAVCLFLVRRQGRRAEVVYVVADRVSVKRLPELDVMFADHPYWVRVVEDAGRVWLQGRQRRVEVGGFLGEDERQRLADELRRMLRVAPPASAAAPRLDATDPPASN